MHVVSAFAFASAGVACIPAPTDFRANRAGYDILGFVPSFRCLSESFQALRERAGIAWYRLRK